MLTSQIHHPQPFTQAVRQALEGVRDARLTADLLFLEAWEIHPTANLGVALRVSQIRRANPGLCAAIEAELKGATTALAKVGFGLVGPEPATAA